MIKNVLTVIPVVLVLFASNANAFLNGFYSGHGNVNINNGKCIILADIKNDSKAPDLYNVNEIYYECEIEPGIFIAQTLGATVLKKEATGELSYQNQFVGSVDQQHFYFEIPDGLHPRYDFALNSDGSVAVIIRKSGDRGFEVKGVLSPQK